MYVKIISKDSPRPLSKSSKTSPETIILNLVLQRTYNCDSLLAPPQLSELVLRLTMEDKLTLFVDQHINGGQRVAGGFLKGIAADQITWPP